MPVTNCYSISGLLVGERTTTGRIDYLRDALGSVTATASSSGTIGNRYRYKPYGSQQSKTGSNADPAFRWIGTLGYRDSSVTSEQSYIRRRHYSQTSGRWTSKDLLGFERKYAYGNASPTRFVDPTGLYPQSGSWRFPFGMTSRAGCSMYDHYRISACCAAFLAKFNSSTDDGREAINRVRACYLGFGVSPPPQWIEGVIADLKKICANNGRGSDALPICYVCAENKGKQPIISIPPSGTQVLNRCNGKIGGYAYAYRRSNVEAPDDCEVMTETKEPEAGKHCSCLVVLCKDYNVFNQPEGICRILLHELIHCSGVVHRPSRSEVPPSDAIYKLSICLELEVIGSL